MVKVIETNVFYDNANGTPIDFQSRVIEVDS